MNYPLLSAMLLVTIVAAPFEVFGQVTTEMKLAPVDASHPAPESITQKLKSISLSANFNNATLEEATTFLSIEGKRLSSDHARIPFVIDSEASKTAKPITFDLRKVSLAEVLDNICTQANVHWEIREAAIYILPAAVGAVDAKDSKLDPSDNDAAKATERKLHDLVVDKVNFEELDISAVVQFLTQKSRQLDPAGNGVNFVLDAEVGKMGGAPVRRSVTIKIENVSLADLVMRITAMTNLTYSIKGNTVHFTP